MRKKLFSLIITAALAVSALAGPSSAMATQVSNAGGAARTFAALPVSVEEQFANPSYEYRAGFRYELPGGQVDLGQVEQEMQDIYNAGYAIVEVTASGVTDTSEYGLDSDTWRAVLKTIARKANELGMRMDIHLSFANGANLYVPELQVTDDGVSKELVQSHEKFEGGSVFNTGDMLPVMNADNPSTKLVKVLAAKINKTETVRQIEPDVGGMSYDHNNPSAKTVDFLDMDSVTDITDRTSYDRDSDKLTMTSQTTIGDAGENWVLIALYERGLASTSNIGSVTARKMNYFSQEGTDAFTDFYDTKVFDDELRALMRANGGNLFSDSYGASANWTDGFLDLFKNAKEYNLETFLPILFTDYFDFDGEVGTLIRNDHKEVLTNLYCTYHLNGLTRWANSLGLQYRDQVVYSAYLDMMQAAMHVDIPETESLYFIDAIDNYLAMSAPANLTRKSVVSTELGALRGAGTEPYAVGGYSQLWEDIIIQANRSFAGGINQNILHTFPYESGDNYQWPGYTAFGARFSENWGPRLPQWQDAKAIADYLARGQYILQQGVSQRDVVIYKHNYDWSRWSGEYITDHTLTREGYTFDFINPAMMEHENAYAEEGMIDPEGGAYRAFIIDSEQYPFMYHFARPETDMIPLSAAQKIQEYANAGVPIIVVGEAPSRTEGYGDREDNGEITAIFKSMADAGQITYVSSEAEIASALRRLEIRPNADNNTPSGVTSYLRQSEGISYYFLYNNGSYDTITENQYAEEAPVDQIISFKGEGQPYLMDMWSGEITPIADYTIENGYVSTRVQLDIHESALIAVSADVSAQIYSVTGTDQVKYNEEERLVVLSAQSGVHSFTLSNGQTAIFTADALQGSAALNKWTLKVDSWSNQNPFDTTFGRQAAQTKVETIGPIELNSLVPWNQIKALSEEISGIGYYAAQFNLDADTDAVLLEIGEVFDTVSVAVDGQIITGINQLNNQTLLPAMEAGTHTLEITSVSTLRNVLRSLDSNYASKTLQEYGIVGPVVITPLAEYNLTAIISYEVNGGKALPDDEIAVGNTISAPDPVYDGYDFEGWYTSAEFNQIFDDNTIITEDTTLYAKWASASTADLSDTDDSYETDSDDHRKTDTDDSNRTDSSDNKETDFDGKSNGSKSSVPKTGDAAPLIVMVLLFSAAGLVLFTNRKCE